MSKKVLAFVGVVVMLMQFALPVFAADGVSPTGTDVIEPAAEALGAPGVALDTREIEDGGGLTYAISTGTDADDVQSYTLVLSTEDEVVATLTDIATDTDLNGVVELGENLGNEGEGQIRGGLTYTARVIAVGETETVESEDSNEAVAGFAGYLSTPTNVTLAPNGSGGLYAAVTGNSTESDLRAGHRIELYSVADENDPQQDVLVKAVDILPTAGGYVFNADIVEGGFVGKYAVRVFSLPLIPNDEDLGESLSSERVVADSATEYDSIKFSLDTYFLPEGNGNATLTDLISFVDSEGSPITDGYDTADVKFEFVNLPSELDGVFEIGEPAQASDPWTLDITGATAPQTVRVKAIHKDAGNVVGYADFVIGRITADAAELDFEMVANYTLPLGLSFTPDSLKDETLSYEITGEGGSDYGSRFEVVAGELVAKTGGLDGLVVGDKFTVTVTTGYEDAIKAEVTVTLTEETGTEPDSIKFSLDTYFLPEGDGNATLTDLISFVDPEGEPVTDGYDVADVEFEFVGLPPELAGMFKIGEPAQASDPWTLGITGATAPQTVRVMAVHKDSSDVVGYANFVIGKIVPDATELDFEMAAGYKLPLGLSFVPDSLKDETLSHEITGEGGSDYSPRFEIIAGELVAKTGGLDGLVAGDKFTVTFTTGYEDAIEAEITVTLTEESLESITVNSDADLGVLLKDADKDGVFDTRTATLSDLLTLNPSSIDAASLTDIVVTSSEPTVATATAKDGVLTITPLAPGLTNLTFTAKHNGKDYMVTGSLPVYVSADWGTSKPTIYLGASTSTDLSPNSNYNIKWSALDAAEELIPNATIFASTWSLGGNDDVNAFDLIGTTLYTPGAADTYNAWVVLTYTYVDSEGNVVKGATSNTGFLTVLAADPTAVTLDKDDLTLTQYKETAGSQASTHTDLTAALDNKNGLVYTYTWTTSDKDVVSIEGVDKDGKVASDTGEATVQLVPGTKFGTKATVEVTVTGPNGFEKTAKTTVTTIKGVDTVEIKNAEDYVGEKAKLNVGKSLTFSAILNGGDKDDAPKDKTVYWQVVQPKVGGGDGETEATTRATISSKGKLTAVSTGEVWVRAYSQDAGRSSAWLKLQIVQPVTGVAARNPSITVPLGEQAQLLTNILPADATDKTLTYEIRSGKDYIATLTDLGHVTVSSNSAHIGKTAKIRATNEYSGKYADFSIKVGAAFDPSTASQTDIYKSSAKYDGDAENNYTYTLKSGKSIKLGSIVKFNPTGTTNKNLLWTSGDTNVATVSSSGTVKGVNAGTTTITAEIYRADLGDGSYGGTAPEGKFYTLTWTIRVNKTITKVSTVELGGTKTIKSIEVSNLTPSADLDTILAPTGSNGADITWAVKPDKNGNYPVASVTDIGGGIGRLSYVGNGKASLTATAIDKLTGTKKTSTITVYGRQYAVSDADFYKANASSSPAIPVVIKKSVTLSALFGPGVTEKGITWTSDAPSIAKVSSKGKVTGVAVGSATITATAEGGAVELTFNVEVNPASASKGFAKGVGIVQSNFKGIVGQTYNVDAYPTSDFTHWGITWTSSNEAVATFVDNGVGGDVDPALGSSTAIKLLKAGTAKITAKDIYSGKSKTITVTSVAGDAEGFATAPTTFTVKLPKNTINKNIFKPADIKADTALFVGKAARFTTTIKGGTTSYVVWNAKLSSGTDVTGEMNFQRDGTATPSAALAGEKVVVTATLPDVKDGVANKTATQTVEVIQLVETIDITAPNQASGATGNLDYIAFPKGATETDVKLDVVLNASGETPHWNDPLATKAANGAPAQFKWATSNKKVATVEVKADGVYVVKGSSAGTATITLSALDGGKTTGTIKVSAFSSSESSSAKEFPAEAISITGPKGYESANPVYVSVGKANKFSAVLTSPFVDKNDPALKNNKLVSSEVIWSYKDAGIDAADITLKTSTLTMKAAGELTLVATYAADQTKVAEVKVIAGSPVTKVEANQSKVTLAKQGTAVVSARVTPSQHNGGAISVDPLNTIEWSVSSKDDKYGISFVDMGYNPETGYAEAQIKAGDVLTSTSGITVTALNKHSGKKSTFKLVVTDKAIVPATGLTLKVPNEIAVPGGADMHAVLLAPGKSATLKATVLPNEKNNKATGQSVVWASLGGTGNITVDKAGKVKVSGDAAIGERATIVAIPAEYQHMDLAQAVQYHGAMCVVLVGDRITKLTAPKTLTLDADTQPMTIRAQDIDADWYDYTLTGFKVKVAPVDASVATGSNPELILDWKSTNTSVCTAQGVVYDEAAGELYVFVDSGAAGKATLTGTAVDGSGKKVTVTVTVKDGYMPVNGAVPVP